MKKMTKQGSLVVALSLVLTACSGNKSPSELVNSAKSYIQNNENAAAEIELKMAIQENPSLAEARYLLGLVYLDMAKSAAAEKEFAKAMELGFDLNQVAPVYAKSYALQDKYNEIIELSDSVKNLDNQAKQQIDYYLILAHINQGSLDKARDIIAATEQSDYRFAKLIAVYDAIDKAEVETALQQLNTLVENNPEFDEALLLKGQLAMRHGKYADAAQALEAYLTIVPTDNKARFFLAEALYKLRKMDEAEVQVDALLAIAKEHPFLNQLKGSILFGKKDFEQAKIHLEKSVQNGSVHTATRLLAGITNYNLNNLEQAYQYLVSIQGDLPQDHVGKKLLGVVQLKLGYDIEAAETLLELEGMTEQDAALFAHASYELLKDGDKEKAKQLLANAESKGKNNAMDLARIGFLKLSLDDISGLDDLETALNQNPDIPIAKLSIAQAYIQQQRYEEALKLASDWIKSNPNEVAGYNLSGITNLQLGKRQEAENNFTKALAIAPNNVASLNYFINTAIEQKDNDTALKLAKQITTAWPDYLPGLVQYFSISREFADTEESLTLLTNASEKFNSDMRFTSALIKALIIERKPEQIIEQLQGLSEENIADLGAIYWLALGDSYTATGQSEKALETFRKWQFMQPGNRDAWIKSIVLLDKSDPAEALRVVRQARQQFAEDPQLALLEVYYNVQLAKPSAAQRSLDKLTKELKNSPEAQGLQGQIYLLTKQYAKAQPLLVEHYQAFPSSNAAIYLYQLFSEQGLEQKGIDALSTHIEQYPQDVKVITLLADRYLRQLSDKAIPLYQSLIELNGNNTFAMNNLAWLLSEKNELAQAQAHAEKAAQLEPANPHILNTLGTIYIKQNKKDLALKVLSKALTITPNIESIKATYQRAQAL